MIPCIFKQCKIELLWHNCTELLFFSDYNIQYSSAELDHLNWGPHFAVFLIFALFC